MNCKRNNLAMVHLYTKKNSLFEKRNENTYIYYKYVCGHDALAEEIKNSERTEVEIINRMEWESIFFKTVRELGKKTNRKVMRKDGSMFLIL